MQTITVKKKDLIQVIKQNREKHLQDYNTAVLGYKIKVKEELEKKLKELERLTDSNFENFEHYLKSISSKPTNNLKDYDVALGMLEITTEKEIQLDINEYRQYYLDEWHWKNVWTMSNTGYIGIGTAAASHKLSI